MMLTEVVEGLVSDVRYESYEIGIPRILQQNGISGPSGSRCEQCYTFAKRLPIYHYHLSHE